MAIKYPDISKAELKQNIIDNLMMLYRKSIEDATPQQVFQAVAYALKEVIFEQWMATHKEFGKQDSKIVYYMSMEFLMGRALGNNLINLKAVSYTHLPLEK